MLAIIRDQERPASSVDDLLERMRAAGHEVTRSHVYKVRRYLDAAELARLFPSSTAKRKA